MATKLDDTSPELVTKCPICAEEFSLTVLPKFLPCAHVICRGCLLILGSGRVSKCPLSSCKTQFLTVNDLDPDDLARAVDALPTDKAVLAVASAINVLRSSDCGLCREGQKENDVCVDCKLFAQRLARRSHVKCRKHRDSPVELYCPAHLRPICALCVPDHIKCGDMSRIQCIAEQEREVLTTQARTFLFNGKQITKKTNQLEDDREETEQHYKHLRESVTGYMNILRQQLDAQEHTLLQSLTAKETQLIEANYRKWRPLKESATLLLSHGQAAKRLSATSPDCNLLETMEYLRARWALLETETSEAQRIGDSAEREGLLLLDTGLFDRLNSWIGQLSSRALVVQDSSFTIPLSSEGQTLHDNAETFKVFANDNAEEAKVVADDNTQCSNVVDSSELSETIASSKEQGSGDSTLAAISDHLQTLITQQFEDSIEKFDQKPNKEPLPTTASDFSTSEGVQPINELLTNEQNSSASEASSAEVITKYYMSCDDVGPVSEEDAGIYTSVSSTSLSQKILLLPRPRSLGAASICRSDSRGCELSYDSALALVEKDNEMNDKKEAELMGSFSRRRTQSAIVLSPNSQSDNDQEQNEMVNLNPGINLLPCDMIHAVSKGSRVRRGPDWSTFTPDVDGGSGGAGVVKKIGEGGCLRGRGWVLVLWERTNRHHWHRMGAEGCCDLTILH